MNNIPLHETKLHGTPDFPYIVYHGKIPDFINTFPLHWHDELELIYITKGQMNITIWSHSFPVYQGDIVIILPHVIHSIEQTDSHSAEYFNILFNFSLLSTTEDDICYTKYLRPFLSHEKSVSCYAKKDSSLNHSLAPLLSSLIENRRNSYTTHEYFVKSNLYMIMHYLNQHSIPAKEDEFALQLAYNKIKTALYHIQNCYSQNITVQEAANLCGFSESHFMKLFKELTGTSFTKYLVNYRLDIAAKQLTESQLSITEVANNCGFNNHSYFTRTFSKKYGLTPQAYRKSYGQSQNKH